MNLRGTSTYSIDSTVALCNAKNLWEKNCKNLEYSDLVFWGTPEVSKFDDHGGYVLSV